VLYVAETCEIKEDWGRRARAGCCNRRRPGSVLVGSQASDPVRIYAEALLVAEPDRDLVRHPVAELLRRSSFESLEDLEKRVRRFIDYFNETMAKPMKWLYSPKPRYEEADTD